MNELGFAESHVVEAIVNHISGHKRGVAGKYNHAQYLEQRKKPLSNGVNISPLPACAARSGCTRHQLAGLQSIACDLDAAAHWRAVSSGSNGHRVRCGAKK